MDGPVTLPRTFREIRRFPPAAAFSHGTRARYVSGCRCDDCRRATAVVQRARTLAANNAAAALPPPAAAGVVEKPWRFGRPRRYRACPGLGSRSCPHQRAVRKDSMGGRCRDCRLRLIANDLVDAGSARRHLVRLEQAGIGRRSVAAACDVSATILSAIKSGDRRQLRRRTRARILAVTVKARADHSLVSAARTWRWIQRLLDEGFTRTRLARELGSRGHPPALQIRRTRVLARTELRVARLYRRLTA